MNRWKLSSGGVTREYDEIDRAAVVALVIRDKGFDLELTRDGVAVASLSVKPGTRGDIARLFGSVLF